MILPLEVSSALVGAVVIGRNEGERLRVCLLSLLGQVAGVVYVDSGSTDGSVSLAESLGIPVVNLDLTRPFTAARARNEGFSELMCLLPQLEFVQFVDGDCEVVEGWVDVALHVLNEHMGVAIACGRRKERFPGNSVYNQLCDIEWDTPIGESNACGGDALMRVRAFEQVNGYNPSFIAGEEPEMCVRLRQNGWKIWRLDAEMTLHDASMTRFSQWWKRALRSGHAYAEVVRMHGAKSGWSGQVYSNWLWGMSFLIQLMAALLWPSALLFLFVYPVQVVRIYQRSCLNRSSWYRWLFAVFCVLAKLPLMFGQLKYYVNLFIGQKSRLIEYK